MVWYGWVFLTLGVLASVAAAFMWWRWREAIADVAEARALAESRELRAQRAALRRTYDRETEVIKELDDKIVQAEKTAVNVRQRVDRMSAADVAAEFRKIRNKAIGPVAMLCILALGAHAHAQEPGIQNIDIDGHGGVWFPLEEAHALLAHQMECDAFLPLYRAQAQSAMVALNVAKDALDNAEAQAQLSNDMAAAAEERALLAEQRAAAWWRSPLLWGGLGAAVGAVVAVFVVGLAGGL